MAHSSQAPLMRSTVRQCCTRPRISAPYRRLGDGYRAVFTRSVTGNTELTRDETLVKGRLRFWATLDDARQTMKPGALEGRALLPTRIATLGV